MDVSKVIITLLFQCCHFYEFIYIVFIGSTIKMNKCKETAANKIQTIYMNDSEAVVAAEV